MTVSKHKTLSLRECLCMKPKEIQKQTNSNEMIALNGLDFFPKQFATQAFIDKMCLKKKKSIKKLQSKFPQFLKKQNEKAEDTQ